MYKQISRVSAEIKGMLASNWTVERLFENLPEDGSSVDIYVSFGHVNGREMFGTETVMRNDDANHPGVRVNDSNGRHILTYPLNKDRTVRLLIRP